MISPTILRSRCARGFFRRRLLWLHIVMAGCSLLLVNRARCEEPAQSVAGRRPIVDVEESVYIGHRGNGATVPQQFNAGPGLERIEFLCNIVKSDRNTEFRSRVSSDNGTTWSAFTPRPDQTFEYQGVWWIEGIFYSMPVYDPGAEVLIQPWLIQIRHKAFDRYQHFSFSYYRLSHDHGLTWTEPKQMKYEDGPDFDRHDVLNPQFINRSNCQTGQKFIVHSNGTVVTGVGSANDPQDPENFQRRERLGALDFIGKWNPSKRDYDWRAGKIIGISYDKSSRGLLETDVLELKDGRILHVWRGSDTKTTAGHKWFGVSDDGGVTINPPEELKYDDGTSFYSPSTMLRLFRSQLNGKAYFVGNICAMPPKGNSPRHPLVIAEIDETKLALVKDTVTVIADRKPNQAENVQYSNFSLLEDPETHQIELFLANYGAYSGPFGADAMKYVLTFR